MSCPFHENWKAGVWNQGVIRILFCLLSASYVEITLEAKIYRVYLYLAVGVIFDKYILSSGHKLSDVDSTGNLYSWSGTPNEQKIHIIMW